MTTADEMGLTQAAAQGYENDFIPAIFGQWPPVFIDVAKVGPGDEVLDVGCGTGVLTRELVPLIGASGSVTAVDLSENMLSVARETAPGADFRQANVMSLPFGDDSFDAVISAFMLMFVAEPDKAISEMWRVVRPGGRVVTGVWEALDANPVYSKLVNIVTQTVDKKAGDSIAWPFSLGTQGKLDEVFQSAGAPAPKVRIYNGVAKFPSVDALVKAEVESWLLVDSMSEKTLIEIIAKARDQFSSYCDAEGQISFPFNAAIAVSTKSP